jgi:dimeric dUTPase (all-alpha-NTP-PPase superfamily)
MTENTNVTCKLTAIFEAQRVLLHTFHAIEFTNGFKIQSGIPVDINDPHDQLRLKEFAWRVTEEIGEAVMAAKALGTKSESFLEEVSDALHFLVELSIISGITPSMLHPSINPDAVKGDALTTLFDHVRIHRGNVLLHTADPCESLLRVVVGLTRAMNLLKNRPWKQSLKTTDAGDFRYYLLDVWEEFILACLTAHISADELHRLYFQKHRINQERQKTGV